MLTDWIHWLTTLHTDRLLLVMGALLLIDGPRYGLSKLAFCLWDCGCAFRGWVRGDNRQPSFSYCPSVCVIVAGYNEEKNIPIFFERIQKVFNDLHSSMDMGQTYEYEYKYDHKK